MSASLSTNLLIMPSLEYTLSTRSFREASSLSFALPAFDVHDLTMNHNLCVCNGFLDIAARPLFQSASLLLPLANNIPNTSGS